MSRSFLVLQWYQHYDMSVNVLEFYLQEPVRYR
jgi:hypothetical protein